MTQRASGWGAGVDVSWTLRQHKAAHNSAPNILLPSHDGVEAAVDVGEPNVKDGAHGEEGRVVHLQAKQLKTPKMKTPKKSFKLKTARAVGTAAQLA